MKDSLHEYSRVARAGRLSRREWVKLGAGALLSLGLWPGCARFANNGRGQSFSFVAVNDTHYQGAQCGEWFKRVALSIKSHRPRPEFCLVVGDLAEHGTSVELGAMRDVLRTFEMPYYAVIGNHDYASPIDRRAYETLFPGRLNYHFSHRGWQFIGLDSSEGINYRNTRIQPATFQWLERTLPKLKREDPLVLFTHFPLGEGVPMRPMNADHLLAGFLDFNLVAVFNGHFHGITECLWRKTVLTTNRCCAVSRNNHDGTKEKGYFLCNASPEGIRARVHRSPDNLEHFQQYCSHAGRRAGERSFWILASFRLSHRVALNLLLRQSLAKTQKSSLRVATVFFQTL